MSVFIPNTLLLKKKKNHYYNTGQCNYYHKVLRIVHLQFTHFVKNRLLLCIADMDFFLKIIHNLSLEQCNWRIKQVLSKLHFLSFKFSSFICEISLLSTISGRGKTTTPRGIRVVLKPAVLSQSLIVLFVLFIFKNF